MTGLSGHLTLNKQLTPLEACPLARWIGAYRWPERELLAAFAPESEYSAADLGNVRTGLHLENGRAKACRNQATRQFCAAWLAQYPRYRQCAEYSSPKPKLQ